MKRVVIALALMLGLLTVAAMAQSTGYTEWSAPESAGPHPQQPDVSLI